MTVIDNKLSGLRRQAEAATMLADMLHVAADNGATMLPYASIHTDGGIDLTLRFTGMPIMREIAAWQLVLGPYQVRHVPFQYEGGLMQADVAQVTLGDFRVTLNVTYPSDTAWTGAAS